MTGSLRTFRVDHFIKPSQDNIPPLPRYVSAEKQVGGTPISWTPGVNANLPLGSEILLGDKPEAIPRRVQLLLKDDEVKLSRAQLIAKYGGLPSDLANGYQKLSLTHPRSAGVPVASDHHREPYAQAAVVSGCAAQWERASGRRDRRIER